MGKMSMVGQKAGHWDFFSTGYGPCDQLLKTPPLEVGEARQLVSNQSTKLPESSTTSEIS